MGIGQVLYEGGLAYLEGDWPLYVFINYFMSYCTMTSAVTKWHVIWHQKF